MSTGTIVAGVLDATDALHEMLENPWSYFPNLVGGDLVGLGQIGPVRFLVAFGKSWSSGTPSKTDPPTFSSPQIASHPKVFDVDVASRTATEVTPSLLLYPNASLRSGVMTGTGMHLVVSTDSGTHVQFMQNFAHRSLRGLAEKPLSPSVWSNGEKHPVEWDRGAAPDRHGFIAVGADSENRLYASRVKTTLSGTHGYDPSRRSYLSDKGWTRDSIEQTPLCRDDGTPLASTVPVGIIRHRQWWYLLIPKRIGTVWGWELLRGTSLNAPFRHIKDVPGNMAGPAPARFFPGIALKVDPEKPSGLTWCSSPETEGTFVPRLSQLQV